MSDQFDPPGSPPRSPAPAPDLSAKASAKADPPLEAEASYPWDKPPRDDATADPGAPRQRHDAFNEARKSAYLTALAKTGCLLDACRRIGVSPRTVYRHQDNDPRFREHCEVALRMSATPVELTAWQRAVEGVDQEFACGGEVHVRRRYSDGLLRLLLQGSNPKKYGPRPGFTRKRLLKHEKKQLEREVRAELEIAFRPRSLDDVRESILRKLSAIERHREPERLAAGWTKTEDGDWIPPGYGWVGLPDRPEGPDERGAGEGEGRPEPSTPRDSM